jgi:hypothetical protein
VLSLPYEALAREWAVSRHVRERIKLQNCGT